MEIWLCCLIWPSPLPAWAKAVSPQLWQLKAFGARRKNNPTSKTRKIAVSKNQHRVSNFFLILQQTWLGQDLNNHKKMCIINYSLHQTIIYRFKCWRFVSLLSLGQMSRSCSCMLLNLYSLDVKIYTPNCCFMLTHIHGCDFKRVQIKGLLCIFKNVLHWENIVYVVSTAKEREHVNKKASEQILFYISSFKGQKCSKLIL